MLQYQPIFTNKQIDYFAMMMNSKEEELHLFYIWFLKTGVKMMQDIWTFLMLIKIDSHVKLQSLYCLNGTHLIFLKFQIKVTTKSERFYHRIKLEFQFQVGSMESLLIDFQNIKKLYKNV